MVIWVVVKLKYLQFLFISQKKTDVAAGAGEKVKPRTRVRGIQEKYKRGQTFLHQDYYDWDDAQEIRPR